MKLEEIICSLLTPFIALLIHWFFLKWSVYILHKTERCICAALGAPDSKNKYLIGSGFKRIGSYSRYSHVFPMYPISHLFASLTLIRFKIFASIRFKFSLSRKKNNFCYVGTFRYKIFASMRNEQVFRFGRGHPGHYLILGLAAPIWRNSHCWMKLRTATRLEKQI